MCSKKKPTPQATTPVGPAVTKPATPEEATGREKSGQTHSSSNEWEEVTQRKGKKIGCLFSPAGFSIKRSCVRRSPSSNKVSGQQCINKKSSHQYNSQKKRPKSSNRSWLQWSGVHSAFRALAANSVGWAITGTGAELPQLDILMEVEEVPPSLKQGRNEKEEEDAKYIKKERKAGWSRAGKALLDAKTQSTLTLPVRASSSSSYLLRKGAFLPLLAIHHHHHLLSPPTHLLWEKEGKGASQKEKRSAM